jgi:hypothetical protein
MSQPSDDTQCQHVPTLGWRIWIECEKCGARMFEHGDTSAEAQAAYAEIRRRIYMTRGPGKPIRGMDEK